MIVYTLSVYSSQDRLFCNLQHRNCRALCMCVTTSLRDLRLSQLYCRRLKPSGKQFLDVLKDRDASLFTAKRCKKVSTTLKKRREIFMQRHSATRRNTRTLRSDSSIIFVRTDNVTRTASADSQQSPCCYFTLQENITKKVATHNFRGLYQNIQLSSYLFFL